MNGLRMRNIFDPANMWQSQATSDPYITPPIFGQQPPGIESIGPMTPEYDMNMRLRELYSPENTASERFNQLLQNFPQRQEPSTIKKLLSGVVGLGQGPEAQERALYGPYNRQLEDWKAQVNPAMSAANLERQQNINERMLANQVIGRELQEKRDIGTAAYRQARIDIADFKARNPNMRIVMPKGGNVTAINPQTGESKPITNASGKPISAGSLSDEDRLSLQQEYGLERIEATGEQARKTETLRQTGRETLVGLRGAEQRKTLEKRRDLITKAQKDELPSQTKTRIFNNAQRATIEYPEWADYIETDPRGIVTVAQPSTGAWWSRGPDEDTYDAITEFIYGNIPGPPAKQPTGSVVAEEITTTKPPPPTTKPTGEFAAAKRQRAIKILRDAGKPVTDANIAHVEKQLK